ncbi:MAG: hypothetical protein FWG50_13915 [Kiritimatiellaeota bacterium]|nr:hypothetical protein [Kiritimatiellota bacterium]
MNTRNISTAIICALCATGPLVAVACSWPTPFGFLVPMAMGKLAVGGGCLAETGLLFSMTRPCRVAQTVPFSGHAPLIVWVMLLAYLGTGVVIIRFAFKRFLRK